MIRNSFWSKVLWGFLAAYLFNISIDTVEPTTSLSPSEINLQESFVEVLLEKVLGFEDAIAEYAEHENEDHNYKKQYRSELIFISRINFALVAPDEIVEHRLLASYKARLTHGHSETDSPPPEA